jgi:hypothetical protein
MSYSKRKTQKYKRVYKDPSIYIKKNNYGLGTYTRKNIPANTIILKERPSILDEPYDDVYKFKLIRYLLKHNKREFLNLVPRKLDETTNIDYEILKENHLQILPELNKKKIILYYYKIMRNWFRFDEKGVILFYGTKLNHSCNSNITYYKKGDVMVFETKRDIKAGEELFDSYINCQLHKEERQSKLKKNYGFECGCDNCKGEISI